LSESFKKILEEKRNNFLNQIKKCVLYLQHKPGGATQFYPDGNYVYFEEEYWLYHVAAGVPDPNNKVVVRKYIMMTDNELELLYKNLYSICLERKEEEYNKTIEDQKRKIIQNSLDIELEKI
jgi:hypothetical protein